MKFVGYLVLLAAALASLAFVQTLKPTSFGASVFFSAWLVLPYLGLTLMLIFSSPERKLIIPDIVVAIVMAAGGMLFLTDVIFLHPDPQGGIAVLFTPIYQAIGIGVLLPASRWLAGRFGP